MNNLNDYRSYFANLAATMGISFEYGNSERILNRQSAQLTYPLLWLEVPSVRLEQSGGMKTRYMGAFVLLSDAAWDDWQGQDAASDAMYGRAMLVLQAMSSASEAGQFDFQMGGCSLEKKEKWSADDDWGWRVEFEVVGACDCC